MRPPIERRQELVEIIRRVRNRWRCLALRGVIHRRDAPPSPVRLEPEALRFSAPRSSPSAWRSSRCSPRSWLRADSAVPAEGQRFPGRDVPWKSDTTLQTAILSAVETWRSPPTIPTGPSPRLVESSSSRPSRSAARWTSGSASRNARQTAGDRVHSVVAAVALLIALGPAYLRHGLSALLVISERKRSPYHIDVKPGDAGAAEFKSDDLQAPRLRRQGREPHVPAGVARRRARAARARQGSADVRRHPVSPRRRRSTTSSRTV